ncbi:MAG: hypothetical protein A2Y33_12515 [Spirochaetes bacterium GWF1_51_8]|nr:MAG: hypothetical protein A2Y33_12515 [Spirochaetes bacterium GWF1_51_8]
MLLFAGAVLETCASYAYTSPIPDDPFLRAYVSKMTPEEKIGQLFMLCLPGTELTPEMKKWISDHKIGGMAIFGKNVADEGQLIALTRAMQTAASGTSLGIPLFIATDHEPGDSFMPIKLGKTFPYAKTLAAKNDPDVIRKMAEDMSADLTKWGINMNFYPVADIDRPDGTSFMSTRSFGSDPNKVAEYTGIVFDVFESHRIISVAKHFPGHGGTAKDSHKTLPVINKTLESMKSADFIPYYNTIKKGLPAVMMAHILYPKLDPKLPATLSKIIIRNILRKELGFQGLVVSDEMLMDAIKKNYSIPDACRMAIEAGIDIILITRPQLMEQPVEQVYLELVKALKSGKLSSAIVDDSVCRILIAKNKYLGFEIHPQSGQ